MSLEYHPDTVGAEGGEMFQKLLRAYEVLSDADLRRVYDQEGIDGVEEFEKKKATGESRGVDPFAAFFGFGGQQKPTKRASIEIPLFISLKDLYLGKTLEASVFKQTRCKKCRGTGAKTKKDIHKCHKCNGQGVVLGYQNLGYGRYREVHEECPVCKGKGKIVKRECDHCKGKKVVAGVEELTVDIEKGMNNGETITFAGMCDEVAGSTDAPGDVVFKIHAADTEAVRREGNHLHLKIELSLKESLIGFKKEFEHFDGHVVGLSSNTVTAHGHIVRIKGEGMPIHDKYSEYGDLVVTYTVGFPKELTEEQKKVVSAWS